MLLHFPLPSPSILRDSPVDDVQVSLSYQSPMTHIEPCVPDKIFTSLQFHGTGR